jgi:hypothetical protein
MPLSDAAIVGAPIVAESNFGDGFRDDFNTLDIETSTEAGNRSGKWKLGFIHANMAANGFTYGSDENAANGDNFVHAAINFETQVYEDTRKPNPTGATSFAIDNGVLKITSRLVNAGAETEWAKVKDYNLNPDGTLGTFVRDKQAKYTSGMISTYGRFAMSFGRFRWKVKTPYGAVGNSADVNARSAVFPAPAWLLQDIPYGCDINGEPFGDGLTTYRPARPNGGGIGHEIDVDENFGESATDLHQTVHAHPAGTPQGTSDSSPLTLSRSQDLRSAWRVSGADVFPEKIAFFVDGVYTHIVATTDEVANGLPIYEPQVGAEYDPVMDSDGHARVIGRQTHADGSTRYMCHVMISNLARDGKYPRDLAKQVVDAGGTLPAHLDTVDMEIDYAEARPLLVDNPDAYPMRINGVPTTVGAVTAIAATNPRLVIHMQPAIRQGRPAQQIVGIPKDGYDPTGKTFTWASSAPELTFLEQGTLTTTPSLQGLSADQLATITIDDGE